MQEFRNKLVFKDVNHTQTCTVTRFREEAIRSGIELSESDY